MRAIIVGLALLVCLAVVNCTTAENGPVPSTAGEKEPQVNNPVVLMKTSLGDIKIELWADKAPETVKNFLSYVDDKHYDGTIFHRVIANFMIQGGGMTPDMKEKKTKAPVKNEAGPGLDNKRGTLAMARTNDPHSATAQFFINVADNDFLNHKEKSTRGWGYCVFGKVTEGMDVVDKIKAVATKTVGPHEDVPVTPVVIQSVTRVQPVK
jgi:peptidyl-prolyl cis-trans isomerase B (cyclophilin B)